jgi:TrmH family RNA methyltransferase
MTSIESALNGTFKRVKKLMERRRARRMSKRFVIEGRRELERARQARVPIEFYLVSDKRLGSGPEIFPRESQIYTLPEKLFARLSQRENPDGWMAVALTWPLSWERMPDFPSDALFLLAEGVEKPGNLGGLIRSAEAAGVRALFLVEPKVDIFNPSVVRNSQGAIFELPLIEDTRESIFKFFRQNGVQILATTPGTTTDYWSVDMRGSTVVCVGSEANGLSDFWLRQSVPVRIPLYGRSADSLNLQVAATLCLYEARRQRNGKKTWQSAPSP